MDAVIQVVPGVGSVSWVVAGGVVQKGLKIPCIEGAGLAGRSVKGFDGWGADTFAGGSLSGAEAEHPEA